MKIDFKGAGMDAARLDRIRPFLDRYVEEGRLPCWQVAVHRHGHPVWRGQGGLMDVARGRPVADDTIFRIYSMTKPVTSVALMSLFEQGRFQLDDPVAKVFPEWADGHRVWTGGEGEAMTFEPARRPISFRDLLSHTSGLTYGKALADLGVPPENPTEAFYPDLREYTDRSKSLDGLISALGQVPLRFQPGERWMYSLASDVCGALVERISGQSLAEYFDETIFKPLGMRDTAFHVAADKADRLAANYYRHPKKGMVLADDPATSTYLAPPVFDSGGGGLVGTIDDYVRFAEMLRRGGELDGRRILGPRTLELMTGNHLKGGRTLAEMAIGLFSEASSAGAGFGLGFAMTIDPVAAGTPATADFYWGGAASTYFWVDPADDITVVFMTQLMPSSAYDLRRQLKSLVYAAIED